MGDMKFDLGRLFFGTNCKVNRGITVLRNGIEFYLQNFLNDVMFGTIHKTECYSKWNEEPCNDY